MRENGRVDGDAGGSARPGFGALVRRYALLVDEMTWESIAYTVTVPDSGVLTVADAIRRLGYEAGAVRAAGEVRPGDLGLRQAGRGVITCSDNPYQDAKDVTDRLAGEGFRHWYLAGDIEGNTTLYVRYGDREGRLEFPEPGWIPFTPWTESLGPLAAYEDVFTRLYDTWADDPEMCIDGTCLAVIERESGVRLDESLWIRPMEVYLPTSG
ncbi:hypothetical protein HII36_31405 [Nonomuraea sp. NN258]|uniref:hypothetical protein n=1 Tax=Nonomuraea antri TaxID=2730852 RepID=UPI00156831E4|nr:hypothetical protein [Nonomuraea antri]NRQ36308.1 hypothetical protein [Nonomuraea antri]